MNSNTQLDAEKLLYKLILQFAIYTQGTNNLLDPHLSSISHSLKQGINYQELNPELLSLSKTLAHISLSDNLIDDSDSSDKTQQKYFLDRLYKLLHETDVPSKFKSQCEVLKQKTKSDLDDKTYKKVIDSAVSLLLKIKEYVVDEKQDIETFLTEISVQLNFLEKQVHNVSKSTEESIGDRENLNEAIEQQVGNIKNSAASAKELTILKKDINYYIQELSFQFQKHKEVEDNRQQETQQQLQEMSQKMQKMEVEADSLRNNLKLAHDQALRDPLTNLPNRLAYDERISVEYNRWFRYKEPLTVIIWDIDLFKQINDKYGHKAGDRTLALVAQLILNNSRNTDFAARFGGEEFVMLLPNTTAEKALLPAEKIREKVADSDFNYQGESIKLTISCGISEFSDGDTFEDVFERADKALYLSKKEGRNKCSIISCNSPNLAAQA